MSAAKYKATNVVRLLKQHGADVNKRNSEEEYALSFAIYVQDQYLTEELLPTVIPTGYEIRHLWSHFAQLKPKMTNPIKNFIQQTVNSGWCLDTFCLKIFGYKIKCLYWF